jgi:predicted ATPase/DNA-binding SARP family transcriptional activator/Tfp pilus assembly protein PilF
MARLSIQVLGTFQVLLDGQPATGFESAKVRALLVFLAVEADRPHLRDTLAELLWSNQSAQAARKNLRTALANLRHAIQDRTSDPPFLDISNETIQIHPGSDFWVDAGEFAALLAACEQHAHHSWETCAACAQRLQAAAELYQGNFLEQFFASGSSAFEDWLLLKRDELQQAALQSFSRLSAYYERRGKYEQALQAAKRRIEIDPLHEPAQRHVIYLLARSGQRSAALQQYSSYQKLLADELGVEPEPETTDLYKRIRSGAFVAESGPRRYHLLPAQTTSFLGRDQERAQIAQLLERPDCRLLTIVGPPGIGKTRLALQITFDLREHFADGVAFIPLAAIHDPKLVMVSLAHALNINIGPEQSPLAALAQALRDQELLLTLDNFEQVQAAAAMLGELLMECPCLKILATSRVVLHVYGEHQYSVPPLSLPDDSRELSPEEVAEAGAVQLFVDRVRAVQSDFQLNAANARPIGDLCVRLEGLPLAIELAAARAKLFPPQALLKRLDHPLKLLTGGAHNLDPRQQTLRGAIDWSYQLLNPDEQRLFARLGVFVGGCTTAAAEAICDLDGDFPWPVEVGLARLLDHSLLRHVNATNGGTRVEMLEMLREYALEQLAARGEIKALRQRHASYYTEIVEMIEQEWRQQPGWVEQLDAEHPNLRAALSWALEAGNIELAGRLSGALWRFWFMHGHPQEGRQWYSAILEQHCPISKAIRAKVLLGAGTLACQQSDLTNAYALLDESLALYQEVDDKAAIATTLNGLGMVARQQGDFAQTQAYFEASLAQWREINGTWGIAVTLGNLGELMMQQGDLDRAREFIEESLMLQEAMGAKRGIALSLCFLGAVLLYQGDSEQAQALLERGLAVSQEIDDKVIIARALYNLGLVALYQGQYEHARRRLEESLLWRWEIGYKEAVASSLEGLAALAAAENDGDQAALLLGVAEATRAAIGAPLSPMEHSNRERVIALIREQIGDEQLAENWQAGQSLSLEEAVAEAIAQQRPG